MDIFPKYSSYSLLRISVCFLWLSLVLSCKKTASSSSVSIKTEAITFTKEGKLQIFKRDALIKTLDIEFAESDYEIQTGLMYRNGMENYQGMLFVFPDEAMHSFYMKNTEFPLDIIFIDENRKIVSFQKHAQPLDETSLSSKIPVKYVLEINAGLSDAWKLTEGDSIDFTKE